MKRVRINWRRLLFVTTLVTAVVLGSTLGLTRAGAPPPPSRTVRVQPGDTLWGIAQHFGPERTDLRRLTFELERVNGLEGKQLRPGMELTLPVAWQ